MIPTLARLQVLTSHSSHLYVVGQVDAGRFGDGSTPIFSLISGHQKAPVLCIVECIDSPGKKSTNFLGICGEWI